MKERTWKHCRPGAGTWAGMFLAFVVLLAGRAWAVTPNVAKHTQNEVQDYLMKHAVSTKEHQTYTTDPILDKASQTYIPGELSEQSKKDALQVLNNIRYIAGLNYNVTLDDDYGVSAQAGAFVNCAINQMTHTPKNDAVKPDGMPDELWDAGDKGCGSSNLAWNSGTLNRAVFRWTGDEDYKNIFKVGHRRWVLNPTMGKTGFGAADPYYAMISMDPSASGGQSRVVWPAQEMPVEYFDATFPWTISVGSYINNPDNVKVTLTRTSDGKTWLFDTLSTSSSSDTKSHFYSIDNSEGLAQQGCIIFRPENFEFQAGETYHVKAENVNSQTIEYDVHFFKGFSAETASFAKEKYYALSGVGTYLGNELIVGPGEAEADTIVWESSDPSVFKVDQEGNVTGTGRGSAVLTATVNGALKATCTITVLNVWYSSVAEYAGGDAVPVNVTVTDSETGEELKEGSDYRILYYSAFHNDDPTSPTITEVGESDFFRVLTGEVLPNVNYSFSTRYRVVKKAITDEMVSVTPEEFQYNGSEQKPTVEVKHGNTILQLKQDYEVEFSGGTNAGDYTVTIKGAGKHYTGIVTKEFHIAPKKLSEEITVTSSDNLVYNGEAQLPDIVVTDGEKPLIKGTDYELVLNSEGDSETFSINAGDYKYRIKGIGNYTSEIESTFTIHPRKLDEKMVSISDLTYNCQVQDPAVTILDIAEPADGDPDVSQESNLITKEDYDLAFFDENGFETEIKDAAKYTLTVTGERNYTGTLNVGFAVSQASMKDIETEEIKDQIYTSEAIEPAVVLTYQGVSIPKDDYSCKYTDNIHAGTATISIIPRKNRAGHTNFKDEAEVKFNILPRSIEKATMTLKPDTAVYNGKVQKVDVSVSVEVESSDTQSGNAAKILDLGVDDYDVVYLNADGEKTELVNAGSYSIKVTAKGNYTGTAEAAFIITPKPIGNCTVSIVEENLTYNGESHTPAVKVTDGEQELKEGRDYTVSTEVKAVNAGSYKVIINGIGNYTGETAGGSFTIIPKEITQDMIDDIPQQDADAAEQAEPALVIWLGKTQLEAGKDFTVAYENNTSVGDATAIVTGQGNFTGTARKSFRICRSIAKAVVVPDTLKYTEDGTEKKPGVTVTLGETVLAAGTDYNVSYKNNVKPGTAEVIVTGAGYYMGSASAQFTIEAKPKPVTGGEGGDGVTEPMNPENAPTAEEVEAKVTTMADNAEIPGSGFAILQANAKKIGKNYVKLGWNRVKGAEGYILYGNRCGKSTKMQRIAKLAGGSKTSMKVTKLADGKTKLKKGTYYKFVVVAYARDSLGREKVIASSKSVHIITNGHKKYTNYKGVKVSKSKVSVKKGKTVKITAKAIVPAGKKVSAHRKLKCESTDPTAVKVTCNKAGTIVKIKGLKKTSKPVIIFVYAQSGKSAKIKVTVN